MISVKNGTVSVEGTRLDLTAELTVIMRSMIEKGIIDKKTLDYAVELATSDKEKLDKEFREAREAIVIASLLFGDFK